MTKEKLRGNTGSGKQGGLVCVFIYPDGKMVRAMLLLHPVCHTSGQTHTLLSVTCTCAITTISHLHILWKVKPVLSLQHDILNLLKKHLSYVCRFYRTHTLYEK